MTLSKAQLGLIRGASKSTQNLIEFLASYLEWPLPAGLEPSDVEAIEWDLDELRLDRDAMAKLTKAMQIPRFVSDQQFGAFVLQFEGGSLPVGAVRRLVNQLVKKRRLQAKVNHEQWEMDDLIFFCQSNNEHPEIHVVSFEIINNKQVLKAISWGSNDSDSRIQTLAERNLAYLKWRRESNPGFHLANRELAFTAQYREGVKTSKVLAALMAEVAKHVRSEVEKLYAVETEDGPLKELFQEVRRTLDANITPAGFADMYAQTMVYGLLTARITHPEEFLGAQNFAAIKFENPFLDSLYAKFRSKGDPSVDVDEFGLHDLWQMLAEANIDQILSEFGTAEQKNDPVVFFYEEFLAQYDPSQRKELGAYYTPIPVVEFMVSAVDSLIKTKFDLADGISDTTTWAEYSRSTGIEIPAHAKPDATLLRMLDPATGTGTFLLEWIRKGLANIAKLPIAARATATDALLSSFDAFEISLSSYSVAQLKVQLEIPEDARHDFTPNIFLTNSLSGKRNDFVWDSDPISMQSELAEMAKFSSSHNVVIGNPPYLRVEGTSAAGWLADLGVNGKSKFDDIHDPAKLNTIFSHQANLFNLYVYFWRFALWKAFEQNESAPGIVAMITASSWLRGPGFMGLRKLARDLADEIYVIDLGGDGFAAVTDDNIFPIKTPVSIVICLRNPRSERGSGANVLYKRVEGSKQEKLEWLGTTRFGAIEFERGPAGDLEKFVPATGDDSWQTYSLLTDLFPWQTPGCKWNKTWPVATTKETIEARWQRLLMSDDLNDRAKCYNAGKTGRNIDTVVGNLPSISSLPVGHPAGEIVRYGYRSFDRQWSIQDPRISSGFRPALWNSASDAQLFMVSPTTGQIGQGPAATFSAEVPDLHYFHGRGGKDVFPLYRGATRIPNSDPEVLDAISLAIYGRRAVEVSGFYENLFNYCAAILAGTDYTDRFSRELETPGARVPITCESGLFEKVADHGRRVVAAQLFEPRNAEDESLLASASRWEKEPTTLAITASDVRFVSAESRLYFGDGVAAGISSSVWDFQVSGMPVLRKWLGYRTARGSGRAVSSDSPLDSIRPVTWSAAWSAEFLEVVDAVERTIELQKSGALLIDAVLEGPIIDTADIPSPSKEWRNAPAGGEVDGLPEAMSDQLV